MKSLLFALSVFLLSACVTTKQISQEIIYINTGEVQCESAGQTGIQTARLLTDNNIEVSKTQCGQLTNIGVASVCGGATVNINIHAIPANKVSNAQDLGFERVSILKHQGDLGYNVRDCQ